MQINIMEFIYKEIINIIYPKLFNDYLMLFWKISGENSDVQQMNLYLLYRRANSVSSASSQEVVINQNSWDGLKLAGECTIFLIWYRSLASSVHFKSLEYLVLALFKKNIYIYCFLIYTLGYLRFDHAEFLVFLLFFGSVLTTENLLVQASFYITSVHA